MVNETISPDKGLFLQLPRHHASHHRKCGPTAAAHLDGPTAAANASPPLPIVCLHRHRVANKPSRFKTVVSSGPYPNPRSRNTASWIGL